MATGMVSTLGGGEGVKEEKQDIAGEARHQQCQGALIRKGLDAGEESEDGAQARTRKAGTGE